MRPPTPADGSSQHIELPSSQSCMYHNAKPDVKAFFPSAAAGVWAIKYKSALFLELDVVMTQNMAQAVGDY